jgi:uncharacterized protein (UPF0335 family)
MAANSSPATSSSVVPQIPPPIIWTTHRLNQEQILKVDKIFHKILWLDLFESHMLNELVNAKLGVVLTKKQRKQLQARMTALDNEDEDDLSSAGPAVEEEVKPILFDLKLVGFDAKAKIKVIKVRCIIFTPLHYETWRPASDEFAVFACLYTFIYVYRRYGGPWSSVSKRPKKWWKERR